MKGADHFSHKELFPGCLCSSLSHFPIEIKVCLKASHAAAQRRPCPCPSQTLTSHLADEMTRLRAASLNNNSGVGGGADVAGLMKQV